MRHDPASAAVVVMLRGLKMYGMAHAVGDLIEQGAPAFEAAVPMLAQLLKAEVAEREVRSIAYQIKAARFPAYKDLTGFDFASSEVNEAMVRQLHRGEFMAGADNVVLIGGPGTGKTHIATALGVQAAEHHRKKVRFFSTVDLVNALEQEKTMNKAGQLAERLLRLDLVVLDELGYLPFSPSGGALLFHLLSKLYERTSVVITTNLSFSEWAGVFGDPRDRCGGRGRLLLAGNNHNPLLADLGGRVRGRRPLHERLRRAPAARPPLRLPHRARSLRLPGARGPRAWHLALAADGRASPPKWIETIMATASRGDELIEVVVRLPRKAVEDTLLTARAANQEGAERRLLAAKAILAGRRRRASRFTGVRFYDPSWDMLLELYVAAHEQRVLAVSQLCSLSGGSTTTALRHIENIEALGYIRRGPDPADGRRLIVSMLALLGDAMDQWLDLQIGAERLGL